MQLSSVPVERRAEALEHLRVAYMLLLVNEDDGRRLEDDTAIPGLSIGRADVDFATRSGEVRARFLEAQGFIERAATAIGAPERPLRDVPSVSETASVVGLRFDVFDFVVNRPRVASARSANAALAEEVRALYDAIRGSDARVASAPELPSLRDSVSAGELRRSNGLRWLFVVLAAIALVLVLARTR